MNEILEFWKRIENTDLEHELFGSYVEARNNFLNGIKNRNTTSITINQLDELAGAERKAFKTYLEHRTEVKPE